MPAIKSSEAIVSLRGELEAFNRRTDDGWGFGTLRIVDSGDAIVVKFTGKILGAKPGDTLELQGSWVDHPSFGRQFKVRTTVASAPTTMDGVTAWLSATLPGIGPKRAAELVAHFGSVDALWHAIEHEHGRLSEVPGLTDAAAAKIHTVYMESRSGRDNQIALRGWGLTDNQIQKCLDYWKTLDAVVAAIRDNPYQLSQHVHGFGFTRADEVALRSGIKHNAPERVEAGIVHTLETATSEGHAWVYGGALQRIAADDILKVTHADVYHGILRALKHKQIVRRGKRIYVARMEVAEAKAARGVHALIGALPSAAPANDNARVVH